MEVIMLERTFAGTLMMKRSDRFTSKQNTETKSTKSTMTKVAEFLETPLFELINAFSQSEISDLAKGL